MIKYLGEGGTIGETGWTVSVEPYETNRAWKIILTRDGLQMVKGYLAGTDAISAAVWHQACAEAAAVGQPHTGDARRKLKAPWLASVTLNIQAGPKSASAEATGLQMYVAFALLDQFGFDGGLK
jgi:hypothetical protein